MKICGLQIPTHLRNAGGQGRGPAAASAWARSLLCCKAVAFGSQQQQGRPGPSPEQQPSLAPSLCSVPEPPAPPAAAPSSLGAGP